MPRPMTDDRFATPGPTRRRRGLTSGSMLVIVIAVLLLLSLGYVVGSLASGKRPEGPKEKPTTIAVPTLHTTARLPLDRPTPPVGVAAEALAPGRAAPDSSRPAAMPRPDRTAAPAAGPDAGRDAAPPIRLEPALLDFGTVDPHATLEGEILIHNVSGEPVTIVKTVSSCTCTVVDLMNVTIEPGASVPMPVTFESGTRLGERRSMVRVAVRQYPSEAIEAGILANVALAVTAEPSYITALDQTEGVIEVRSRDHRAFSILAVDGAAPDYVDYDPLTEPITNAYWIRWDLSGVDPVTCLDADGEPLRPWLVIETDHPGCPVMDLQVRHDCTRVGRRTLLGAMPPGEPVEFEIQLRWFGSLAPYDEIHAVTCPAEGVEAELVRAVDRGSEVDLTVRVWTTEDHPGGLVEETLWFSGGIHEASHVVIGRNPVVGPRAGS